MQLQLFKYEENSQFQDLTVLEINGEPWFIANEVCEILGIQNSSQAVSSLDEDEKLVYTLHMAGQNRQVNIISESGMYGLVVRSNKPEAKKFRKWITSEVIPSIRKTGSYSLRAKPTYEKPVFIQRYQANLAQVQRGHFSVITELYVRLYNQFEMLGYVIPDKAFNSDTEIRIDVSVGKHFSTYIKNNYPDATDYFREYTHKFPNGHTAQCRQYVHSLLPLFIWFIDSIWIPMYASEYFKKRDVVALDYIPKLLN